jgi:hypothetical protein
MVKLCAEGNILKQSYKTFSSIRVVFSMENKMEMKKCCKCEKEKCWENEN